jgi:hypothetical protein
MKKKLKRTEAMRRVLPAIERWRTRLWLIEAVRVLEVLETVISVKTAEEMLNVFGNLRSQRIVAFVDRQVPNHM